MSGERKPNQGESDPLVAYKRSLRLLLQDVLFDETELGLRARVSKADAVRLAAANLTLQDLGGAELPPTYRSNPPILAWWLADLGGFVFIPNSAEPLPTYASLSRLPTIGKGRDTQPAASGNDASPKPAAQRDESRHSECGHCGAPLLDAESRRVGFGPECRKHYSLAELRRRSTHRNATRTREWVEDVTLEEQMVDGRDRWL